MHDDTSAWVRRTVDCPRREACMISPEFDFRFFFHLGFAQGKKKKDLSTAECNERTSPISV